MTLADAGLSHEPHAVCLIDPRAGGQVEDLLTIDRWVEAEVKGFERLRGIETASPEPQSELLLTAALDLVLEQALEKFHMAALLLDRLFVANLERPENARESKRL